MREVEAESWDQNRDAIINGWGVVAFMRRVQDVAAAMMRRRKEAVAQSRR